MSYFSNYDSVDINLNRCNYEPLEIVLSAYQELKKTQSVDFLHAEINKFCRKVINKFISGKNASFEDIECIKKLCKMKGTNTCRILYRSIQFIDFNLIKYQVFESFYLNHDIEHIYIFVDTPYDWKSHEQVVSDLGLQNIFTPVYKEELRNEFFKSPILLFALPQWVESTLIIPPSNELHFIYPISFDYEIGVNNYLTSNSGKSLELLTLDTEIRKTQFDIEPTPEFYDKFPREIRVGKELPLTIEGLSDDFERDPVSTLNVSLTSNNKLFAHKTYLMIMSDGSINFSTFETENDLEDVKYVVSSIDASGANVQSLLQEQMAIMEVWKQPLRDNLKRSSLIKSLESLGAEKASEQNVKNWADPNRIAPRGENDFRAVLKFAGIHSEEQIKNYFYLAYKRRGDSISIGHKRSYLANEIVKRNIQEKVNHKGIITGEFFSHGIKFQIDEVKV